MSDIIKPISVSVQECARIIGISRSMIYEAIGRGELDAHKDGDRTLITMASIERRQAALPKAKIKPPKARKSVMAPAAKSKFAQLRKTRPALTGSGLSRS